MYEYMNKNPVNYKLADDTFRFLAQQLVEVFPISTLNVWYISHVASTVDDIEADQAGKLYGAYREIRRKFRKAGILPPKQKGKNIAKSSEQSAEVNYFAGFYECLVDPDREKYNDIIVGARWKDTTEARLDILIKTESRRFVITPEIYVESFECLKDQSCMSMLESDFESIVDKLVAANKIKKDSRKEKFFELHWPDLSKKFMKVIKDARGAEIAAFKLENDHLLQAKNNIHDGILSLFALPLYLLSNNKSYSKTEVAEAFFLHVEDVADLDNRIASHKETLETYSVPLQLFVVLVGPIDKISNSYVVFNNFKKAYSSPYKAIETCFKCHVALRSWPTICEHVWLFIQLILFDLPANKSLHFVLKSHACAKNLILKLSEE
ncbi:hypothetical protein TKK_0008040 [Trichogramma kaykai]